MKIKNLILAAALCGAFTITATAETVTNAATPAGVQLTADQVAKLDNSINQIVPLVPAKYQGAVASVLGLLAVLGIAGRILLGWRSGGFWGVLTGLFGGTNTPSVPITNDSIPPSAMPAPAKGASVLRPIAFAFIGMVGLLACLLITGCQNTQAMNNTSGSGFHAHIMVPIPGTSTSLVDVNLAGGKWNNTDVIQPVSTNKLNAPSIAIANKTIGKQNLAGGTGTNLTASANASVTAGEQDNYALVTGDSKASIQDGTNRVMYADGYQGYDPQRGTNAAAK